jgi:hypothetical protein
MSKRKLKRQKKISTPLIAAMIAGVLLIGAAIFMAFGEQDSGTPRLVIDQERIDYGDVAYDTPKTFTLRVTNTGDGTLRFREKPYVQVLEGC